MKYVRRIRTRIPKFMRVYWYTDGTDTAGPLICGANLKADGIYEVGAVHGQLRGGRYKGWYVIELKGRKGFYLASLSDGFQTRADAERYGAEDKA